MISGIAAITFIPFLLLVKLHNRLFRQKDYLEKKIEINRQELQAIAYDTSAFDNGKEFIDPAHLYTYDLDVFGEHSLFQYINRTATQPGKKRLAEWMNTHLKNKAEIEKRQEAVKELAPELEMRQHFRILGLLHKGKTAELGNKPGTLPKKMVFPDLSHPCSVGQCRLPRTGYSRCHLVHHVGNCLRRYRSPQLLFLKRCQPNAVRIRQKDADTDNLCTPDSYNRGKRDGKQRTETGERTGGR